MSALHLSADFVLQSVSPEVVETLLIDRGFALLLAAPAYPAAGEVRLQGLLPRRHYHLRGAAEGCLRTDGEGCVLVPLTLHRQALLTLSPVV